MPNRFFNDLRFSGITHEQWHSLANSFQDADGEGFHKFLRTFHPEPDYSIVYDATKNEDYRVIFHMTDKQKEEFVELKTPYFRLTEHQWRAMNWGTKWDVFGVCNDWEQEKPSTEFKVRFYTAGSPLSEKCMEAISWRFPGALLTNYYGEALLDFCGAMVAKDCYCLNHCETISDHRDPFVRQHFLDIDTRLGKDNPDFEDWLEELSSKITYSGDFSDFIRSAQEFRVKKMTQAVLALTNDC